MSDWEKLQEISHTMNDMIKECHECKELLSDIGVNINKIFEDASQVESFFNNPEKE